MPYIQKDHQKDLLDFKYKGGTSSISYQHLWSPLAEYLLQFIPIWMAPNLITLIAFAIIFFSHLIVLFYDDPAFQAIAAPWKLALFAVTLFMYQHLDNLDGKQARRTKSSSPIGMLFDHGADALSGMIVGVQILKVIQAQNAEWGLYAIVFIIMIPNFLGLWTQYSVGQFKLDRINPIDQGLPSYQLLALGGFLFDYSFWGHHHWFSSYNYQFLTIFSIVVVIICSKMCKDVYRDTKRSKEDITGKLALPVILIAILAIIKVGGMSEEIYTQHFYKLFYIFLAFWGRNLMLLQVSSVTHQFFGVFNRGTMFFLIAMVIPFIVTPLKAYISIYLSIVCVIQIALLCEFIYSFLMQASTILKINIFKIKHLQVPKMD